MHKKNMLIVLLLLCVLLLSSCMGEEIQSSVKTVNSVGELNLFFPNLSKLNFIKCNLFLVKKRITDVIPSPSDTSLELSGTIILSDEGLEYIRKEYNWVVLDKKNIPVGLKINIASDIFVSHSLNESFNRNKVFAHGFVVFDPENKTLYVLSTDIDHPIVNKEGS